MSTSSEIKKTTLLTLLKKKKEHQVITCMTAYDFPTAIWADNAGMDIILVGDSLGMVVLGYQTTLPVTMNDMLIHCQAVSRGVKQAFLVGDMPFMSYQVSDQEAVRNAGRFLQEAGMDAVKLEGGRERCQTIKLMVQSGIPVMGHLGLTPQSVNQLGGFRSQGKTALAAKKIFEDALLLQEAGCFSIVLESIPSVIAAYISKNLDISTIGIGSGNLCDGQVLVMHDMLGMLDRKKPRFVKTYVNMFEIADTALKAYKQDVENRSFPTAEQSFDMAEEEWANFQEIVKKKE